VKSEALNDPYQEYKQQMASFSRTVHSPKSIQGLLSAFKGAPYAFAKDIMVVMDKSLALKEDQLSLELAVMLLKRGCPMKYFNQQKFNDFRTTKNWQAIVGFSSADRLYSPEMQSKFKEIYKFDQLIASNFMNANVHPRYPEVTERFLEFYDQYGFPSEKSIGMKMVNDSTIGMPYYHVVMLHHYHMSYPLLLETFDSLKKTGEIDYRHAEAFADNVMDKDRAAKLNAQREWSPKRPIKRITVYTDNVRPICEEEYLYVKEQREVVEDVVNAGLKLVYLDWNGDSIFNESGVDFFGFVNNDGSYSCFHPLKAQNTLLVNGEFYEMRPLNYKVYSVLPKYVDEEAEIVSFNSQVKTLQLEGGVELSLNDYPKDKSIIYFYATWCKPCIKTLVAYNEASCEQDFNFLPIALESSPGSLDKLFENKGFQFGLLIGAESLKQQFEIKSFPTAFLVSGDGEIESELSSSEVKTLIKNGACK
jgi:thiol-disulfide isomerase/thioredoxin